MNLLIHDYAGHPFQVDLSRELARRGHKVTHAYFAGDPGPKGALARRPGDPETLSFVGLDISSPYTKGNFVRRRFQDLEYGRAVAKFIRRNTFDLVISGNTPTESQGYILNAARATGTPFISWIQDFYSIAVSMILKKKNTFLGGFIGNYYQHIEKQQLKKSDSIVVITDGFRDLAAQWSGSPSKIHVIENWGAISDLRIEAKNNAWAAEHGLTDSFVFLYSGTLGLKHNPEFFVALAREALPGVKIVVVAQGLAVEQLRAAKEAENLDNLVLLPLQPFERLPEVLGSADVLVSVIEAEAGEFSVPSKVQSYLCVNRPILLAAPHNNLAAIVVGREKAGLVVPPDDQEQFLDAARTLADDARLRSELGQNGRAYAMRTYDIQRVADRFEDAFRTAWHKGRNRPEPVLDGQTVTS